MGIKNVSKIRCETSGVPEGTDTRTEIEIVRLIALNDNTILDLSNATLGKRLRYLRRRLREPITVYATHVGLAHSTISRLERDKARTIDPAILGRLLSSLKDRFKEAFPDIEGDIYDFLIPPKTFGDRLRNLRLRHGLQQKVLAQALGVARFTLQRYEYNQYKPSREVMQRLDRYIDTGA